MKTIPPVHKNIRITGRVQGVGFRNAVRNMAMSLCIHGFVRNLPEGSVYIEAEGPLTEMQSFIQWCHEGPVRARVQFVDVYDGELRNFKDFTIR